MKDIGHKYYMGFLSGSSSDFEKIVELYRGNLILFIQQYVRDYQSAEDVAQNVFIKLYVKKPHYSPKALFKTWLYTMAKRDALSYIKEQKQKSEVALYELHENIEIDYLEAILANERKIKLHYALDELNPDYRQVLYLYYFEDFSVSDISILLKIKPQCVSDRLYNAKKALKSVIIKGGTKYEILRTSY